MNALYKRIVTIGMISITALLAWFYCIIAYRDKAVYVVGISIILIASLYVFLNALIDLHVAKQENLQKYISDLVSSSLSNPKTDSDILERLGKASYIQLRKSADSLSKIIEDNQALPITETINKATKVIIKYNGLNNEKLLDAIGGLSSDLNKKPDISEAATDDSQIILFPSAGINSTNSTETDEGSDNAPTSDNTLQESSELLSQDAINMFLENANKIEEAIQEEIPAPITPSINADSNRQLTQEEIAALFTSMQ